MAISMLQYAAQSESPMRQGLIEKITNESWFLRLLKFITLDGFTYEYNRRDTLGGIAFRALNETYTADIGVVNPQIERTAILGGSVLTDYQIASKPTGAKVRSSAIAGKARKIGLQYDKYVLQGDQATNPRAFFGLNARLVGNQLIVAGTNGAALTLDLLDQAIDQTVGADSTNKIIVCNKYIRRQITKLVRPLATGGVITINGISGQLTTYRDCPIIVMDEDGDEAAILSETETTGSSNITTSLYVVRLGGSSDGEYVQGLAGGATPDHVGPTQDGTVIKDVVEANIGLAMFHPRSATRLKGLL